jgi:hypothetical protein
LAAGYDKSAKAVSMMEALGFGFLEIGSVSADYGLPNEGAEVVARRLAGRFQGPRCESGTNTTAMYGSGESDRLIVAEKRANKDYGAPQLAECVERSGLTKGNSFQQTRFRTQCR